MPTTWVPLSSPQTLCYMRRYPSLAADEAVGGFSRLMAVAAQDGISCADL
jgi:hypothetical protein